VFDFYEQKQGFVEVVDELLTKLDEYVGFADLVRFLSEKLRML